MIVAWSFTLPTMDGAGINRGLHRSGVLFLRRIELNLCSVAQGGFMALDVKVVLDAYSRPVERARLWKG